MILHLITLTLLIAVVLLIRALFGKRIPARMMYALWLAVLIKLCLPFSIATVDLPLDLPPFWEASETISRDELLSLPTTTPTVSGEIPADLTDRFDVAYYPLQTDASNEQSAQTSPPERETAPPQTGLSPMETMTDSEREPSSELTLPQTAPTTESAPMSLSQRLAVLWLVGSLICLSVFTLSGIAFRIRLGRDRRFYKRIGRTKVYVSAVVGAPCLFGLIPSIYLTPAAMASDVRSLILLHEYTHLRHGDHIWTYVRIAAVSAYWWNPLVWLAAFVSQQDAELACDEAVTARMNSNTRIAYARGLVDMIPQKRQIAIGFGNGSIKERILRLTDGKKKHVLAAVLALTVALAAVGCSFIGINTESVEDESSVGEDPSNRQKEEDDGLLPGRYLHAMNDTHFFVDDVTLYQIVSDDGSISFAELTDGDVIRIKTDSALREYPAKNAVEKLEKVGDGNPEAVQHVLTKLAEYGFADVNTEHFMQAKYFLYLSVAEIEEHFGELKLEYSEAGPGQPVYSISDVEGVHLVFHSWHMDDPLKKTMIPSEVILTSRYPYSINGLKMGARIADVYDSNMIWSNAWYDVINGTAHMKKGGGAYDMEMVLHGFDYGNMPNEETASDVDWDKWEAEFLKNPSGTIGNMRLSLTQPSIVKQNIDSDGIPEIFQINVVAHGTELWIEEVHAFDGASGKTLDLENPRTYLKKNAVFESDAEVMSVTIDGKTQTFNRDSLDTPKENQNLQLSYGLNYDYYVTADDGLGCAVGLMAGPAEYCGYIDLQFKLENGTFVITEARPRANSKTPPIFDAEAYGKTIPPEKGSVLFWHRIFASGTVLYFCSPPKASDADKFIVYYTIDYGETLNVLDIEMPHDIDYDTIAPVYAGGGGGSGECRFFAALMNDGKKTYVSYDNFSYTDGRDWLNFAYRGVIDTEEALQIMNIEHHDAYQNGVYSYKEYMAVPSVREELTLRVNEALQAYREKSDAYPGVYPPFPEGYPIPKDLTVAEAAAFSTPFSDGGYGAKILIPLVYESNTPNGRTINKRYMDLRWSVGIQSDYNVRIYLFSIDFPLSDE